MMRPDMTPGAHEGRCYDVLQPSGVYFAIQEHVLYIHRGWDPAGAPIALADWRDTVKGDPDLLLDEIFEEHNVNAGYDWRVYEPGRAGLRIAEGERVHFAPARVLSTFGKTFRGSPSDKWQRIARRIGPSPSLAEWLKYLDKDRYFAPVEEWAVPAGGPPVRRLGSALFSGHRDKKPRLFRYEPPCVWLYRSDMAAIRGVEAGTSPLDPSPAPARLEKALALAARLGAFAFDGVGYLAGTGQRPPS